MYWPRFISGVVLIFFASVGVAYLPARAQVLAPQAGPTPDPLIFPSSNTPLQPSGSPGVGSAISEALDAQAKDKITNSAASERTPVAFTNKDMASTYGTIMAWIMSLFAWLLGVAMLTLDYTVYYTVVNMGSYIHNLTAVGVAWRILRDIGNIALIFGFLAVGITTILNVGWYGNGKKFLPGLLMAAVFLNFSLFMTEAVIDAGNLFATQFYTQINGGSLPKADSSGRLTTAGGVALTTGNEGVSNKIMAQLGLQDIYGRALSNTAVFEGANTYLIGFMGTLLFIIASFVIFSLAFILIARFIALVFLMILAPVGFAGLAIPQLEKTAKQWWSTLVEQTITAPILLLLLYIALAVITDAQFLTGFGSANATARWDGFINGTNLIGFAGLLLSFLVAMGLLLSVTYFSKKLGAFGGAWAMKAAGAAAFGSIALAGRGTFGAGGYLLNNKYVQARASKGGVLGYGAKALAFTGRNLENKTFDFRNIRGMDKIRGMPVVGEALAGALEGQKATAKSALDATREGLKYVKPFSGDWWRNQSKEYEKAQAELDRKNNINSGNPAQIKLALKKMSEDEIAELKGIRQGLSSFAEALSPATYNTLSKSPKLLEGEKTKLKAAWDNQFTAANASTTIGRFSTEEVASLDGGTLMKPEVVTTLGTTEFEAIRRKGSLNTAQRRAIYTAMTPAQQADYLDPANDPGGNRKKYWNV